MQRRTDMSTLWPACLEHAEDINDARTAFYFHISNDPAWTTDYDEAQLINFVDELK
jgi:hypothetical protein